MDKKTKNNPMAFMFDPEPDEPPCPGHATKCRYTLVAWRGDFFWWDLGRWQEVSNDEINILITRHLQEHNSSFAVNMRQAPEIPIHKGRIADIRLCLAGRTHRPELRYDRSSRRQGDGEEERP